MLLKSFDFAEVDLLNSLILLLEDAQVLFLFFHVCLVYIRSLCTFCLEVVVASLDQLFDCLLLAFGLSL